MTPAIEKHKTVLTILLNEGVIDVPAFWARAARGACLKDNRPYSIMRHAHGSTIRVTDADALRELIANLGKPKTPRVLAAAKVRKALEGGGKTVWEICEATGLHRQTVRRELRKLSDRGLAASGMVGRKRVWGML